MDTLYQAFDSAGLVWEQALDQVGWLHVLMLVAHLGAAWLCLLNAHIASQATDDDETPGAWLAAAALLCLLGVNSMLQLDLLLTQTVRTMAKLDGWYGQRRELQYELLAGLVLLALLACGWLRAWFVANIRESEPVALGLLLLLLLLLLAALSAHGTDALLNAQLAGLSVRRLLELAGLGLVACGSWRCLQLR